MSYYLNHFTPYSWDAFRQHGSTISGFPEGKKTRAAKVKPGDVFICYLARLSRWCGAVEVLEGPYIDNSPVFAPANDKYVVRFKVKPLVVLDPEHAIPIGELWNELVRTRNVDRTRTGWAYSAQLISTLASIDSSDGQLLVQRLIAQANERRPYPLDAVGKRGLL
jgi:EVE domain